MTDDLYGRVPNLADDPVVKIIADVRRFLSERAYSRLGEEWAVAALAALDAAGYAVVAREPTDEMVERAEAAAVAMFWTADGAKKVRDGRPEIMRAALRAALTGGAA